MEKRLSSHPSYQLFVTFLPEKQRLSPAKNFYSPSVCDENNSLQWSALWSKTSVNFPPENSLRPHAWDGQRLVYWWQSFLPRSLPPDFGLVTLAPVFFFFFFQPQGASASTTSVELFWYYWNKSVSGLTPNSSTKSTWSLTYSSPRAAPDTNFSSSWGDEATIFFLQLSQLVQYNDIWSHMPILWSS